MSLVDNLPIELLTQIYNYDLTYKEILDESLKFIEHGCPTCICNGCKKKLYRHYGNDLGDPYWGWEWRRQNACPKHNPGDFDKNGIQHEYSWSNLAERVEQMDAWWNGQNEMTLLQPDLTNDYYNYEIGTGRIWYNGSINYNFKMLGLWMFCTRFPDIYPSPIKSYSRKKLIGSRFMDMRHDQRPIVD
jgi:hypothetical protein